MALFESTHTGQHNVGYQQMIKEERIRIMSDDEVRASAEIFSQRSNLGENQFAINSWGFPFIPKPFVKKPYGFVRIAPNNVAKSFFGHPIYWIDPQLTAKRDDEHDAEWSIRMFCLIDAFGYWNKDLSFVDFLQVNDFDFSSVNISVYFDSADQESVTDTYEILDEKYLSMMGSSLEQVESLYLSILRDLFTIQDRESVKMLQRQVMAYNYAKNILGKSYMSWSATYDDSSSIWARLIYPKLEEINTEYNQRAMNDNVVTTDLLKRARSMMNILLDTVKKFHDAANILELPIYISEYRYLGKSMTTSIVSNAATAMNLASRKNVLRESQFDNVEKEIKRVLTSGNQGVGEFIAVINEMGEVYKKAWNRLRLAFINFDRVRHEEPIYGSLAEMQTDLRQDVRHDLSDRGEASLSGQDYESGSHGSLSEELRRFKFTD